MTDAIGGDVERHFSDLENQLQEDGFDPDSNVMKTARRLSRALREDGFSLSEKMPEEIESEPEEVTAAEMPLAVVVPDEPIVRAFRAKDEFDATRVTSVFAVIDGWKTKVIQHKGSHFVVATNAKKLTDTKAKQAIVEYVADLKSAQA